MTIIANYANKNFYYLSIAKKNLKSKININCWDFIKGYDAEQKLSKKQFD